MSRTVRRALIAAGTALLAAGAAAAADWIPDANAAACALGGLACWLASTWS